jgi:hypothetical protein
MIRPHKYLNLDKSVLNVSSIILSVLLDSKLLKYDDLYQKARAKLGNDVKYVFLPALNFLFLLGKIDYHQDIDTLELIE